MNPNLADEPAPDHLTTVLDQAMHLARQLETDQELLGQLRDWVCNSGTLVSHGEAWLDLVESLLPWPNGAECIAECLLPHTTDPRLLLRLAQTFWMLGNDKLAHKAMEVASLHLAPDDLNILHLQARIAADPAEQLSTYQRILELYPNDRSAWEAILALTR
jgi:hypothetical protein